METVVLMEPSRDPHNISLKAGNMYLNRFCIDEDSGFELAGIYFLRKSTEKISYSFKTILGGDERVVKGTEYFPWKL